MESKDDSHRHIASIELLDHHDRECAAIEATGTARDAADMRRMGKRQELQRNFHFISIVGFLTIMQGTWESTLLATWYGLYNGGTAGVIWMTIAVWLSMIVVMACMAELASMAPTAGGDSLRLIVLIVSRVSEFAPPSVQQEASYVTGWFAFFSWVATIPACAQFITGMIQAVILIFHPDAQVTALWQTTLIIFAILMLAFGFNIFLAKYLPLVEGTVLILHVVAFFVIIFLLAFLPEHIPAGELFTQSYNGGGWSTLGLATLVGIASPLWCFIGPDAGAHMSEELKDASRQLPRAMMFATVGNGLLGVPMLIMYCRCLPNVARMINLANGYPIYAIIYASTGSKAATGIIATMLFVLGFFGTCNAIAATSRQCWAFARDGGFPFSPWITKVKYGQPLHAMFVCIALSYLLSFINFGSEVALNAVLSVANAALVFTYMISIGCITLKRLRGEPLLTRSWDLGRAGLPMNLFSMAFLFTAFILSFFPVAPSVGDPKWAVNFNWASIMFVAVGVFASVYFVAYGKQGYVPPVKLVKPE